MWRQFTEIVELLEPYRDDLEHLQNLPRCREAFEEDARVHSLPPLVRRVGVDSTLYVDHPSNRWLLSITDRVLGYLRQNHSELYNALSHRLLDGDSNNARGAWAEACFYTWISQAGIDFVPNSPVTLPAAPTRGTPNIDARIPFQGTDQWWDVKAYSRQDFARAWFGLVEHLQQRFRERVPGCDVYLRLDDAIETLGSSGNPTPTTIRGAVPLIQEQIPLFDVWADQITISGLPEQPFVFTHGGLHLCTARAVRGLMPLSHGGQSDNEIAYSLRFDLASNEHQLQQNSPNIRVVVGDPFSPVAVYSRTTGMASLGYRFYDGSGVRDTEGVLNLTTDRGVSRSSRLRGKELSQLLSAIVYFEPMEAAKNRGPMVFAPDPENYGAVMFVGRHRSPNVEEVGARLGCCLRDEDRW